MDRKSWLSLLATANADQLNRLFDASKYTNQIKVLRHPEIGTVMARGRMGGTGDSFNFGEITVTRCSIELNDVQGHGYVQGRDKDQSLATAILDALLQTDAASELLEKVIKPIQEAKITREHSIKEKSEATRVDFFTRVRGED